MAKATPIVQLKNERVVVTEWRFPPGADTGYHVHAHDYVVVPITSGKLRLEEEGGTREAQLQAGASYARSAGVAHNVINTNTYEFRFVEIELLLPPRAGAALALKNGNFFWDPLKGKLPVGRVVWLYGIVGSLIYSVLGLFFDVANERAMWIYTAGGLLYTLYVTIGIYQCAQNCRSVWMRKFVRISAVLSLLLLPLLTYVALSGVIDLTSLRGEQ